MHKQYDRTFRIDRLYHRFLRRQRISYEALGALSVLLEVRGFIKVTADKERYSETEKLLSGEHKKELFKILQKLKGEYNGKTY